MRARTRGKTTTKERKTSNVDGESWTAENGAWENDGDGENIAPVEIEDVLLQHPAVREAAVVGLPDDEWGQRLAAAVVCRAGTAATADELQTWVRERLRSSKTPDVVAFRDELPHTPTGKLLRREVLADLQALGAS